MIALLETLTYLRCWWCARELVDGKVCCKPEDYLF